jgi:adenylate cyclase
MSAEMPKAGDESPPIASPESSPEANSQARIFISYASRDVAVADAVVATLERHGVACWIAPRDVKAGALYAEAIVRAISDAKALVLVLSESSVASAHVGKEVERASSKRRPVIALRIDDAPLSPALEYFLGESHWIDARAAGMDAALAKLIAAILEPERTVPGITSVVTPGTSATTASPARRRSRNRIFLAAGLAVLAVALAALLVDRLWLAKHSTPEQAAVPAASGPAAAKAVDTTISEKSIAVLPFVNMSADKEQEYFSDGLSEELIDRLSHSQDLKVISRTSSFYFKGKQATIGEIANTLHVSHVLEGSVRKSGRALRITAQLIRTADGIHLWSQTYDRNLADVFKVQEEIAGTVATSLKAALTSTARGQSTSTNVEAYNLLLQGVFFYHRFNAADLQRAVELFQKAVDLDPNYAVAWAWLAEVYFIMATSGSTHGADDIPKARATAARALKLDPTLAHPHYVLARISLFLDWDWSAARAQYQRTLDLDPDLLGAAAGLAYLNGGMYGRWDEQIAIRKKATERDPLDTGALNNLMVDLFLAGHNEESLAAARQLLLLNPSSDGAHSNMTFPLLLLGRPDEALAAAQKEADEISRLSVLPVAYWALGRKAESDAALKELETKYALDAAYSIAEMHAYRGEIDSAFQWFDRAYRQHDGGMIQVRVDPLLQNLHKDQRYKSVLVKMKLDGDPPTALH